MDTDKNKALVREERERRKKEKTIVGLPLPLGDGYREVTGRATQEAKAEGWGEGII